MANILSGFGHVKERVKVEEAMTEAGIALKAAWNTVHAVKLNMGAGHALYTEWFGRPPDKAHVDHAFTVISTLAYAVNSTCMTIRRGVGSPAVAAAAPPSDGSWSNRSVRQILESGKFVMNLYDPYFLQISADRGGNHGPAKTFIHELSHLLAETNEPIGTYPEVYGMIACRNLAQTQTAHAVRNADSWGYFCIAHLH